MDIVTPKVECVASSENYAHFVAEPLESGFGVTLGNALRRVLFSSIPGAAFTWVKIEGVQHEFSTIPHIKEDTTDLLLNFKGIRLRPLSDRPGKLYLEAAGEGVVCAGDIKPSADFEIVNPELYLATLDSPEARLTVEFNIEHGKGYQPAGSADGLPIGVIPIDAIFTPIRKVNYAIEHTRIGQVTTYERLILEVWTDGTISPAEAVAQATQTLINHFSLFSDIGKVVTRAGGKQPLFGGVPITTEQYDTPIEQLGLSVRTLNCLKRGGINKVGHVLEKSEEELITLRNFGQKSLEELRQRLAEAGFAPITKAAEEAEVAEEAITALPRGGAETVDTEAEEGKSDEA